MSFPSAYSLELQETLSAEKAGAYSRLPKSDKFHLEDYKQFQCSEFCSFKLSLTNFGEKNYTKTPYFTPGARNQRHNPDYCKLIVEHYQQREQEKEVKEYTSFSREKNNLIIDIDLVRGALAKVSKPRLKNEEQSNSIPTSSEAKKHYTSSSKVIDEKSFRNHIKQLSALICYFLEYQSGEKYRFFNKDKQAIHLENYFVNLAEAEQKGICLEDIHIYYDTATVDYRYDKENPNKSYFLIRFHHICTIGETCSKPTIIINETKSNHHGVGYKIKTLRRAAKDSEPLKIFFFGSFTKYPRKPFINPNVNPADILDYLVLN